MSKLTLANVQNLQNESSVVTTLAQNNAATTSAMENTLSLDGTQPNQMKANLDMNSNRILNLPDATTDQEPATFSQLNDRIAAVDAGAILQGTYVTVNSEAMLANERVLSAGTNIGLTDTGSNGEIIVSVTDPELDALAALPSAADTVPYFTGSGTASLNSLTPYARTLIADADATSARATLGVVLGTNVQPHDTDLDALANTATTGMYSVTGSGTSATRTITGTANEITSTNGDGVAGNPTLSLPSALTFTGKTVTGGTYTSPTLTTPNLGVATATSINKVALTQPATGSTLTVADGKTLTASQSLTLTSATSNPTITLQGTDTYVGRATTDTLTNKTIDTAGPNTIRINGNVLSATAGSATITMPNSTDTLVGRATTDSLTNKTLTSPTITSPTLSSNVLTTGVATPTTVAANTNDWSPTGLGSNVIYRIQSSANVNITGLAAQTSGTTIALINIGSNIITLTNEDTLSLAANRFSLGTSTALSADQSIMLWYDSTSSRWRPVGGAGSGGGGGGGTATFVQYEYTGTAAQTTFSGVDNNALTLAYTPNYIEVYVNGYKINKGDFTATNGTSVVLGTAVTVGDLITIVAMAVFSVGSTLPAVMQGHLFGLALSTAGSSATFSVATGVAVDSAALDFMQLLTSISKTTSAWTVGTGNGALDTGTIAINTWYHVYLIKRSDTGVVDVLISLSATSPTMPTNYTLKRRIGSMKTNGSSQWTSFVQLGDEFIWTVTVADFAPASITTTASLLTISVPTGIQVNALYRSTIGSATANAALLFTSPDETDQAGGTSPCDLITANSASSFTAGRFNVRTNTSSQIRARSNIAGGVNCFINTYGWVDSRGRNN